MKKNSDLFNEGKKLFMNNFPNPTKEQSLILDFVKICLNQCEINFIGGFAQYPVISELKLKSDYTHMSCNQQKEYIYNLKYKFAPLLKYVENNLDEFNQILSYFNCCSEGSSCDYYAISITFIYDSQLFKYVNINNNSKDLFNMMYDCISEESYEPLVRCSNN